MLSGLFLSRRVKPEEQYQVFKQTESPAVSAFASSGGKHMPVQIQYAGRLILGIFMTIETCHVSKTLKKQWKDSEGKGKAINEKSSSSVTGQIPD